MNVLLVQQDLGRRIREKPLFPIALAGLASRLHPRHRVRIFDPNLRPLSAVPRDMEKELEEFRPDAVGLSIKYLDTTNRLDPFVYYAAVPPLCEAIKRKSPGVRLIAGGAGFSLFPFEIMNDIPALDFGVHLEGEESFAELLDRLDAPDAVRGIFYRRNGQARFSGRRPPPDFRAGEYKNIPAAIDVAPYITKNVRIFGIQTKRGCVFECSYCTYPFFNGKALRLRDPRDVVDEIEFLQGRFGLSHFSFADNIFNMPADHALAICREIASRRLDVQWSAWCDLSTLNRDFLDVAAGAGCRVMDFSPDASTSRGLRGLGKGITPGDIRKGIRLARKEKRLVFAFNFLCAHPGAGLRDAATSFLYWLGLPFVLWKRGRVSLNWVRVYPHTRIHRLAVREGIIPPGANLLAKTSRDVKAMYYRKPSRLVVDGVFGAALKTAESAVKPLLRAVFKMKKRAFPFYYD